MTSRCGPMAGRSAGWSAKYPGISWRFALRNFCDQRLREGIGDAHAGCEPGAAAARNRRFQDRPFPDSRLLRRHGSREQAQVETVRDALVRGEAFRRDRRMRPPHVFACRRAAKHLVAGAPGWSRGSGRFAVATGRGGGNHPEQPMTFLATIRRIIATGILLAVMTPTAALHAAQLQPSLP